MKTSIKELADKVGGVVALSTALGLSRGAVSQWNKVPIERVADVSRLTGVAREIIRPDIFGQPANCDCNQTKEAA